VTNPLTISTAPARSAATDVLVVGVTQTPDGPVPAHGSEDVDAALGGTLAATLAALGATGKQDELTRIASAGHLTAPLIIAAGVGPADGKGGERGRLESLRRAAGTAVRAAAATKAASVALSLPARDEAETEAVALGALLATGGHALLVQLAKIDPELSQVYLRHIRYRQDRYPARAAIWAQPFARTRPTVPLPRELRG